MKKRCLLAALVLAAGASNAATSTATYNFAATQLSSGGGGNSETQPISLTATFNDFDPGNGTLTAIAFTYDYDVTFSYSGEGGCGGDISGELEINDDANTTFGGASKNGMASFNGDFNGSSEISVESTVPVTPDNSLSAFVGPGTFTFDLVGNVAFGSDAGFEMVDSVELNSVSNVVVTYTYTPDGVPEPSTWALLGVGAGLAGPILLGRSLRA